MNAKNKPAFLAIAMDAVESSQIAAIGHASAINVLSVQFMPNRSGVSSVYHYANFTADDFAAFKAAESKGAHFKQFIKNEVVKYPFQKVDSIVSTKPANK
jgi:hypothetical protein